MEKVNKFVFIMTDTWRKDHFGFYGNDKIKTPNLDRFSKKCVVFDKCYSCSYPTMPARADLFTGKFTYTFLGWNPLLRDETVLSQKLQREKYMTGAVVDTPFFTEGDMNYNRGFSNFIFIRGQSGADQRDVSLTRRFETDYCGPQTMFTASRWLERHYKENFFLYIDTWDPHEPWELPTWYVDYYYPRYDGKYDNPPYWTYKEAGLTEDDVKKGHAAYCGEISMVDRWVGHLLDSIEAMNLMDETAIIFTSDHGFYFGEHGQYGKNMYPFIQNFKTQNKPQRYRYRSPYYEEITHVPLLIYSPDVKPRRVEDIVSLPDLMPTVLDLMGVEIPKTVHGQSLTSLMKREKQERRDYAVTSNGLTNPGEITREVDNVAVQRVDWQVSTITTKDWTLLYAAEGQPAELYHLPSDPKQEKNLINDRPEIAQELLNKFIKQMEDAGTAPEFLNPRRRF